MTAGESARAQIDAVAAHLAASRDALLQRWRQATDADPELTSASALSRAQDPSEVIWPAERRGPLLVTVHARKPTYRVSRYFVLCATAHRPPRGTAYTRWYADASFPCVLSPRIKEVL
jgi:hypothetical protein